MGLNLLKFATSNISNMPNSVLMSKISFMKYLPPVRPKLIPKLKSSEVIEIWHIRYFKYAVSIMTSKMVFMKYLPIVRPKLISKLKESRIY